MQTTRRNCDANTFIVARGRVAMVRRYLGQLGRQSLIHDSGLNDGELTQSPVGPWQRQLASDSIGTKISGLLWTECKFQRSGFQTRAQRILHERKRSKLSRLRCVFGKDWFAWRSGPNQIVSDRKQLASFQTLQSRAQIHCATAGSSVFFSASHSRCHDHQSC